MEVGKIKTETVKDKEISELKDKVKQLEGTVHTLRSSSNGWKKISEFFETNKSIKKYHEEIVEECRRDNYFGVATMMIMTIEKLLNEIEQLKDEELTIDE